MPLDMNCDLMSGDVSIKIEIPFNVKKAEHRVLLFFLFKLSEAPQ